MRRPDLRDQSGVAALEMGLLLSLLFVVVALVFPIGMMLVEKHRLDRTLSDTIRFATATPNTPAADSDARRPTAGAVQAAALRTFRSSGGSANGFTSSVTTSPVPGATVSVRLTKTVDLGPLGSLMHSLGFIDSSDATVSASATGREE